MSAVSQTLAAARAAEAAARGVPGVLDLSGGTVGEFATYGDGQRVAGVRVRTGAQPSVALKLVVAFGQHLPELTETVRARVQEAVAAPLGSGDVPVDLDIVDVRVQEVSAWPS